VNYAQFCCSPPPIQSQKKTEAERLLVVTGAEESRRYMTAGGQGKMRALTRVRRAQLREPELPRLPGHAAKRVEIWEAASGPTIKLIEETPRPEDEDRRS